MSRTYDLIMSGRDPSDEYEAQKAKKWNEIQESNRKAEERRKAYLINLEKSRKEEAKNRSKEERKARYESDKKTCLNFLNEIIDINELKEFEKVIERRLSEIKR